MSPRRYRQLERILWLTEFLRQFHQRFGCTTLTLTREVSDRMGERFNVRTIHRDLEFLEGLGFVRHAQRSQEGRQAWVWFWCGNVLDRRPDQLSRRVM